MTGTETTIISETVISETVIRERMDSDPGDELDPILHPGWIAYHIETTRVCIALASDWIVGHRYESAAPNLY
jgi:hypothetical protein